MKIEKLPSGNYRVRIIVGHKPDGKPIRKSFTHYDKTKLMRIAAEYADDHRHIIGRETLAQAMDAFLAAKEPVLSPSTMKGYISLRKNFLARFSGLCSLNADEISKQDVQRMINTMIEDGNSQKTIRNYHGFLSAVLEYKEIRMPRVNLPQKTQPSIRIPDEETVRRIASAAEGTEMEIPVALAIFGLRRSEICALKVSDLSGDVLHIHQATVAGADGQLHTKGTKTLSSDRYVKIGEPLAEKIRKQGYITKLQPQTLSRRWSRLLKDQGLPHYRLHDMRHFFVSYCHNALLLSDAQIQAITGHKTSAVMRSNYLHAMGTDRTGALVADKMSSFWG